MIISEIIYKINKDKKIKIINECDVDILMLSECECKEKACIFIDDEQFLNEIPDNVKTIITNKTISKIINNSKYGLIIVDNPRLTFFEIHNYLSNLASYNRKIFKSKIDVTSLIADTAVIDENNVIVGKNVIIENNVVINKNTTIGDNSIIRAGTIIGGVGFEFKRNDNYVIPVSHCGGVVIGENVEIQCNSIIDRAIYPWDNTVLGNYCKIGNIVYIAHASKIDNGVFIAGHAVLGGRLKIGKNSWIGIGASIRNGIYVGCNTRVNMGAVVTKNVKDGESVSGNFAIKHDEFIKYMKRMDE